jgi:membrane protein DedA with SNARE-associated domain/membrane-associated phospholipid phosphatase
VSIGSITGWILHLHGWAALAIVFLLPALEASAFVGFVFPGEIAVLLGGVLASSGRVSLPGAIAAAVLGAIIGDSVGYVIGKRWGRAMLHGTLGRLPIIKRHLGRHLDAAEAYVRRRKGSAVFFGRFTAALRVLVPGLAGMSEVHYPTFLAYNVAGGAVWGAGFSVLGYLAGESYHRVASYASRGGLILLALVVLGLVSARLIRRRGEREGDRGRRLRRALERLGSLPPAAWIRRRFPRQLAWLAARVAPSAPRGFPLTLAVGLGVVAVWAFAGLTQDVLGHEEMALFDPQAAAWMAARRAGWLTTAMQASSWLGSMAVVVPLALMLGGWYLVKRRDWVPLALLGGALGAAVATSYIAKVTVGRVRPPAFLWVGHYGGHAFPSEHAAQAVAFYAMAALLLGTQGRALRRVGVWAAAVVVALVVGYSRLYLGAHWLSDVLAGFCVGATWVALVWAVRLTATPAPGKTPA